MKTLAILTNIHGNSPALKAVLDDIDTQNVDHMKSTYSGIVSDQYLSNLTLEKRKKGWIKTFTKPNKDESIFVAVDEGETGFSSASLLEAIEKDGRGNVEILFQDHLDNVVIFLNEDFTGQPMLSLNTYSMKNSTYRYESSGEHAQNIDLNNQYEIITSLNRLTG